MQFTTRVGTVFLGVVAAFALVLAGCGGDDAAAHERKRQQLERFQERRQQDRLLPRL